MSESPVESDTQLETSNTEVKASWLTPWQETGHFLNKMAATGVKIVGAEAIIYLVTWLLSLLLHFPFPHVVLWVVSVITWCMFLVFVAYFAFEDLTDYGKQLKAKNRAFLKEYANSDEETNVKQIEANSKTE